MIESDIRPDELVKQQQKYIQEDIDFLISKKDQFLEVNCPACNTLNEKSLFTKNSFEYTECQNCKMLYITPRAPESVLSEFYSNSPNYKFFNDYIFPRSIDARRNNIFIPRVNRVIEICKKYNISANKILEVGAGFGIFCEEMAKTGFFKEVVGVEASDSLAKTCTDNGFRIYNGILEDLQIDEKFDFVASFEVLEHIFNPLKFLQIINRLTNNNGFLMLTFPNYDGFDVSTLREKSVSIDHEHLNYFTAGSITTILEKAGFEVIDIQTPGKLDVDIVRKEIVNNGFETSNFIRKICVDEFETTGKAFQNFLVENKLSSHMMVIARKTKEEM